MKGWRWPAALALLLTGPAGASHITDKLAVGLYDSPDAAQPRRMLASDTPLELLEQGPRLCRVRLGDGDGGWLECRYLTEEKSARALLLEVQARAASLRRELAGLKRRCAAAPGPVPPPPTEDAAFLPEGLPDPPAPPHPGGTAGGAESLGIWAAGGLALGILVGGLAGVLGCRQRYASRKVSSST